MNPRLDTLITALYVTIDDLLKAHPEVCPQRPAVGIVPVTSDSEMITLAVLAALLGYTTERRWLRYANTHLTSWFPHIPKQPGYNKRLRALVVAMGAVQHWLAQDTRQWFDDVWLADSTPIECGRSHDTVHRSDLAGWAQYGYCASYSRYFWGLRLHLVATLGGLIIGWELTGAKADERDALRDILADVGRPGQTIIADKGYRGVILENDLSGSGITMLRPAMKNEPPRRGGQFFKPLRQTIESINATLKTHFDIEHHHGRTPAGVTARILATILALTAAIWHNEHTNAPIARSLTAYDH